MNLIKKNEIMLKLHILFFYIKIMQIKYNENLIKIQKDLLKLDNNTSLNENIENPYEILGKLYKNT
jgi:hypothetical protein